MRTAASTRARNNVGCTVVVHVADGDIDAARERRIIGKKRFENRVVLTAEHFDMRPTAWTGGSDDVGNSVPIHIGNGHADAT